MTGPSKPTPVPPSKPRYLLPSPEAKQTRAGGGVGLRAPRHMTKMGRSRKNTPLGICGPKINIPQAPGLETYPYKKGQLVSNVSTKRIRATATSMARAPHGAARAAKTCPRHQNKKHIKIHVFDFGGCSSAIPSTLLPYEAAEGVDVSPIKAKIHPTKILRFLVESMYSRQVGVA